MKQIIKELHNYIRDYTKISNEDKGFFVACILIALTKQNFIKIVESFDTKEYVYDLIYKILLEYNIDISVFEFLRNDKNNIHFINIIKLIHKIYNQNPSIDLLNEFYSEFVKYNNSDGKNLGIVLTPPHIIKLMISILEIKPDDIFLDLCSGTGSFTLEALKYKPKQTISCEYQNKLFTLLKCNMILRNIDLEQHTLIKNDCFEEKFDAIVTKSAINPPYGMKDKKELDFIIKQLESVKEGGLVCAIVPMTSINNTKHLKLKKKILDYGYVKCIINLNKHIFYPSAAINTIIILIEKSKIINKKTLFINYENDKICIQKHIGLVKLKNFNLCFNKILDIYKNKKETDISIFKYIKFDEEWNFHNYNTNIDFNISLKEFRNKKNQFNFIQKELEILKLEDNIINTFDSKKFYLNELFDIQTIKRTTLNKAKNNKGIIPYISASGLNYGITCYTSFKTHNGPCLTLSNSGSVCKCFYHKTSFCGTDSIYVLYLKDEYNYLLIDDIMIYISCLIEKNAVKYNFGRACRLNKIKNDFIILPTLNDTIDIKKILTIL